MDNDVNQRVLQSKAREYVLMHAKLNYDEIVAHAEQEYPTVDERKAFVDAVLHADVLISNERARAEEAARLKIKLINRTED